MADPLTDSEAVEAALLRPLTTAEAAYAPELIAQISAKLRARLSTVDDRIAQFALDPRPDTAIDPQAVRSMLAEKLVGKFANPQGAASLSVGVGPFTKTATFASRALANGSVNTGLTITEEDLRQLWGPPQQHYGSITVRVPAQRTIPFRADGTTPTGLRVREDSTLSIADSSEDLIESTEAAES